MHPAYSVILFTTSAGAGYGLLFLLAIAMPHGSVPLDTWFAVVSMGLALALITIGLLSSTFHLGHPERAWRALSQWRSSWLSREGVAAVFTYIPAGLLGIAWVFLGETSGQWITLIAALAWIGALATVFCTGQIYASLPTIRQWNHPMTTPVYLLFALASGSLCLNALMRLFVNPAQWCDILVIVSVVCAWVAKRSYWRGIDTARELHTVESATGLGHLGKVKLLDPPHSSENYLMREMGFKVARKHARRLRAIAQTLGLFVPLVATLAMLNIVGPLGIILALVALVSGMTGIAVERWLFFAEAKHTVQLYYGEEAA
ncbi:MAG: DMSO reductase [Rhodospirillaceae bacterium]|nr:DMSO reductase [Rhodospirillaceae bacterium]|tara:strand:+ start:280 stop:1230 length:951 start_codon:yes stop_codon:yes gene_type:complete